MTVAALNCSPGFQPTCRPLMRKVYFPEKPAANSPVFLAVVIHMNGRIYDPTLGRMLQADPFIQFPTNTQSYNRYSYVLNNPLAYTDPSGYFLKELFNVVVDIAYRGNHGVRPYIPHSPLSFRCVFRCRPYRGEPGS